MIDVSSLTHMCQFTRLIFGIIIRIFILYEAAIFHFRVLFIIFHSSKHWSKYEKDPPFKIVIFYPSFSIHFSYIFYVAIIWIERFCWQLSTQDHFYASMLVHCFNWVARIGFYAPLTAGSAVSFWINCTFWNGINIQHWTMKYSRRLYAFCSIKIGFLSENSIPLTAADEMNIHPVNDRISNVTIEQRLNTENSIKNQFFFCSFHFASV